MNRRHMMAALTASLSLPRRTRAAGTGRRVIVVGAGLAGLSAARDLVARGDNVVVLEARDRPGGRIWTSRAWPDLPIDMGASWIHGTKRNPLTALAREAGAPLVPTSYEASLMIGPTGGVIEPDLSAAETLLRQALKRADRRDSDQSVWAAVEASPEWAGADDDLRRLVRHLVNATLEQEYGSPADRLSAWHGDDAESFQGEDVVFPGGFDQITSWLARGLDIRLSQPVASLAPGRVTLTSGQVLRCDHIVLTVPLGVLKAGGIQFDEKLAPARARAIATLEMGLLNKVWLRFDRVAWPDDVDWIEWLGPDSGWWAEWLSLARGLKAPVLLGFQAGHEAVAAEAMSDAETRAAAWDALRAMFGSAFPAPLAAQISRWGRDPWSRGSYSFNAVGTTPDTRAALAGQEWEGALWFAGEAGTRDYFGTAHGAVISGRAVAAMI